MRVILIGMVALVVAGCGFGAEVGQGSLVSDESAADESAGDETAVTGSTTGSVGTEDEAVEPVEPVETAGEAIETAGEAIEVARVIDGDSLEVVVLATGEQVEIRLEGINAPERYTLADTETCVGQRAGDALAAILDHAASVGPLGMEGSETDRFGRLLVDINLATGGQDPPGVNLVGGQRATEAMVASGWALALWSADDPTLTEAMVTAAAQERGWWGDECGPRPRGLAVSDHQVNPPGPDDEVLDQEWVEVTNTGPDPVDLAGWTIRDETTSNRFLLDGPVLGPGQAVRFHSGGSGQSGRDPVSVHLGEQYPMWSNRGETVLLSDPDDLIAAYAFID